MPRTIRYAVVGTVFTAALQVLVGVLLWTHRTAFTFAQAQLHPDWPSARVGDRADGIVVGGMGTHLVLFCIYLLLARGVARGRQGARMRLTALLVITSIAGVLATMVIGGEVPSIFAGMVIVQAISTILRAGVVYLLWWPLSSRAHFAP